MVTIRDLIGKTIKSFNLSDDKTTLDIFCEDGSSYSMYHEQDCCESVWLDDIIGDELNDLLGTEVNVAEERTNRDSDIKPKEEGYYLDNSVTWTFYEIGTQSGRVTLRWCGTSNGYYSESVNFVRTKEPSNT